MSKVDSIRKVEVATLSEISVGIGKKVKVAGEEIALFKQADNSIHAIQNSCPHKGGPLSEGIVSGEHVFCPLHDWKINVKNGVVQAPDQGCVKRYDVEIIEESIFIYID